jgi:hypothetical protein
VHGEENIGLVKSFLLDKFCYYGDHHIEGPNALHFREFLDYLHETCGVIDTTVWERRMRVADLPTTGTSQVFDEADFRRSITELNRMPTEFIRERIHGDWNTEFERRQMQIMGWDKAARPERNTPERKAMALLYKKLHPIQRNLLKNEGRFCHKGKAGHYQFMLNDMSGVRLLTTQMLGGREIRTTYTLCIQSQVHDMPKGDVILARYMECKADEDKFLATCNFREAETPDEAAQDIARVRNINIGTPHRRPGMTLMEMMDAPNPILEEILWGEEA